jgi:hypothetical protein
MEKEGPGSVGQGEVYTTALPGPGLPRLQSASAELCWKKEDFFLALERWGGELFNTLEALTQVDFSLALSTSQNKT